MGRSGGCQGDGLPIAAAGEKGGVCFGSYSCYSCYIAFTLVVYHASPLSFPPPHSPTPQVQMCTCIASALCVMLTHQYIMVRFRRRQPPQRKDVRVARWVVWGGLAAGGGGVGVSSHMRVAVHTYPHSLPKPRPLRPHSTPTSSLPPCPPHTHSTPTSPHFTSSHPPRSPSPG